MHTEQINHDPGGHLHADRISARRTAEPGRVGDLRIGKRQQGPAGFRRHDFPGSRGDQPLYDRLWGTGFIPSKYQGVKLRSVGDPVLYISNPDGYRPRAAPPLHRRSGQVESRTAREVQRSRNQHANRAVRDGVPDADLGSGVDRSVRRTASTFELYGEDARKPGTFASNCLMARRLAERGVRFIQLYHRGWDHHGGLPDEHRRRSAKSRSGLGRVDQDLKQRGLLDDTLVIWGGEFGRTAYCQGKLTANDYGRDHHGRCFTMWMAGGGIKPGMTYGASDDYGYSVAKDPVHVHDLNATILNQLGIDHTRLTYKYQGRNFRLTDVRGFRRESNPHVGDLPAAPLR